MLPDPTTVPIDSTVLETIRQARKQGRKVYMATAADRRTAEVIAKHVGEFDGYFSSGEGFNLKGKAKADRLIEAFGERGFDYIGNDKADLPVWRAARTALVSGATPKLIRQVKAELPSAAVLGQQEIVFKAYLKALRPHQWLKNALIALPAVAAHDFATGTLATVLIAIISFSLCASSIYLINDMIDLQHDRVHPQKRHRPLAAGTVPLSHAAVLFGIVAVLALAFAMLLPWAFMAVLAAYFGLSMSYSVYLKRKLMIDVVTLAGLYGIRVVAGAAATGMLLSHWLVGFSFFIFLCLALVKRTTEMMTLPEDSVEKIKGRGYRRTDLQTITALTASSGFVSVLVLSLYISSPEVRVLYRHPELLWGICVILVYWLGRVCFLTGRGEINQDPVVFAATDRISLLAGLLVMGVFVLAL
jgi:4-hydroxybenzoate polyprenyltransferase